MTVHTNGKFKRNQHAHGVSELVTHSELLSRLKNKKHNDRDGE